MNHRLRTVYRTQALFSLALVLLPAVVWYGPGGLPDFGKGIMFAGTVMYFLFAYLGFRQNPSDDTLDELHTPVA